MTGGSATCPLVADVGERAEGERVAGLLGLEPLPDEGGLFRQTFADAHSSAIYYLLLAPDFSALHRLDATETYHWYAGSPLRLLLLARRRRVDEPTLGPDLAAGERPQTRRARGDVAGLGPCGGLVAGRHDDGAAVRLVGLPVGGAGRADRTLAVGGGSDHRADPGMRPRD